MNILESISVVKEYSYSEEKSVMVLNKIDFVAKSGEFVIIMGRSGSGKTTLLNILGGLDIPTEGCVFIDGVELSALSEEERTEYRRENIGFVFQNYNLLPVLNGYENIILPSQLSDQRVDEPFLKDIAESLEIEEQLRQMPATMSGGEQQRVAIARAVYSKPKIILADEPTGSLDSESGQKVIRLLQKVKMKFGQTIILVTHDEKIADMADRVVYIKDGKVSEEQETR